MNTEEAARGAREDGRPTEARKYIWHTEQNMGLQTVAGKPPSHKINKRKNSKQK